MFILQSLHSAFVRPLLAADGLREYPAPPGGIACIFETLFKFSQTQNMTISRNMDTLERANDSPIG